MINSFRRLVLVVLMVFLMIPVVTNADEKSRKKVFFGAQASFSLLLEKNDTGNNGFITSLTSIGGFTEWKFTKILSLGLYGYKNNFSHPGGTKVGRDGAGKILTLHLGLELNLPLIESMEIFGLYGYGVKTGKITAPSVRMPVAGMQPGEETEVSGDYWVGEFGMRIYFTVKKVTYKFYWSYKIDNLFEEYIYSNVIGAINIGIIVKI